MTMSGTVDYRLTMNLPSQFIKKFNVENSRVLVVMIGENARTI